MTTNELIVVGVDGSPGGRQALRWAMSEALRSGAAVQAVTAWHWAGLDGAMLAANDAGSQRQHAERISANEVAAVVDEFGSGVPIAREVVEGAPVLVLVESSRTARLLVVGSHGHGRLEHALLGSVSHECARQAACPVVVIPFLRAEAVHGAAEPVPVVS